MKKKFRKCAACGGMIPPGDKFLLRELHPVFGKFGIRVWKNYHDYCAGQHLYQLLKADAEKIIKDTENK